MYTKMIQRTPLTASEKEIQNLAAAMGFSPVVAEVLYTRGIDTPEKAKKFLSPQISDLHDPFKLSGMRELVDRLTEATENSETVVVYGDYDADGICATAIFSKFLTSRGATVVPYIPSRKSDGYGVTTQALERLIDEALPDLILTCDCGISAHDEIGEILESGIDVFVTDHHELPRILPDCVCIDPKMEGEYPFDGLCGAGVALKVVQAMAGDEGVLQYIDLATVATVADLVPLVDENRTIVSIGLNRINAKRVNRGLATLLDGMDKVTSMDMAYRVAPRINAAGRMGDAYRAFQLLVSDSKAEIADLVASIDADNVLRKETCNRVYKEAVALIREQDISNAYCLVLGHPDWEKGLTSIVAAQIAGEYKRPTFLVVKNGRSLKGTARSVDGVNIYEVLRACEDLLIEYGGHAQAAGFSIASENVDLFRERVDTILHEKFTAETFLPNGFYDAVIEEKDMTFQVVKELDRLEPFGNSNPRPVFCLTVENPDVEPMRGKPAHLVLKLPRAKVNVNAFNYSRCAAIMRQRGRFRFNVEFSINRFQNREYLNAILRDFDFDRFIVAETELPLTAVSPLLALAHADTRRSVKKITAQEIADTLTDGSRFGTLYVAYSHKTYDAFVQASPDTSKLWHSIYIRENNNNYNRIVLSPTTEFEAYGYHRIILLDQGIDAELLPFQPDGNAALFCADNATHVTTDDVVATREAFGACYRAMREGACGSDLLSALGSIAKEFSLAQVTACYAVFLSLGLVSFDALQGHITLDKTRKCELKSSAGFRLLEAGHDR